MDSSQRLNTKMIPAARSLPPLPNRPGPRVEQIPHILPDPDTALNPDATALNQSRQANPGPTLHDITHESKVNDNANRMETGVDLGHAACDEVEAPTQHSQQIGQIPPATSQSVQSSPSQPQSLKEVETRSNILSTTSAVARTGVNKSVSTLYKLSGREAAHQENEITKGLWDAFDTDVDGFIDYNEFCRYTCDLLQNSKDPSAPLSFLLPELKLIRIVQLELERCNQQLEKAMENIFSLIDHNHSGRISYLEFLEGITNLGLREFNFDVHGHKRRFATTSLFILAVDNPFRYAIVWLIEWKWFDRFILACIFFNSCILGLRDYQDPGLVSGGINLNRRNRFVEHCESTFTIIFTIECALKMIGMGIIVGRGAYLQSMWNVIDLIVVGAGFAGVLPGAPKVSYIRSLRLLRPLRTVTNLRGMRVLVHALISSIPALINVIVVLFFVFTIFGTLGVLIWNGVLYHRCRATPTPINGIWELAGEGLVCGGYYKCPFDQYCGSVYDPPPGTFVNLSAVPLDEYWSHAFTNFDHIGHALLTLFQCITLEGWTSVMYDYQDASSWSFATLYFIIYTIIGSFFLVHFIFAVIWERFKDAKDGAAGDWDSILLAQQQHSGVRTTFTLVNNGLMGTARFVPATQDTVQMQAQRSARKSTSANWIATHTKLTGWYRFKGKLKKLLNTRWFSRSIVFCILLNSICLSVDQYPPNATRDYTIEKLNYMLTSVFALEFFMKLIAFGWKSFKRDRYNLFDGVIVLLSILEYSLISLDILDNANGVSALRILRLFRVLKLANAWKSLRDLINTIANSIMDVANFGLFLLLVMYVFALMGMQIFANKYHFDEAGYFVEWEPQKYNATVPPHAPWTSERPYIIRRSNFDDIIQAFTTVFQCLTEENWVQVLQDGVRSSGWVVVIYFLVLMVLGNIIILNLFLAILLGNFSLEEQQQQTEQAISRGKEKIVETVVRNKRMSQNAVMPLASTTPNAAPDTVPSSRARHRRTHRRNAAVGYVNRQSQREEGMLDTITLATGQVLPVQMVFHRPHSTVSANAVHPDNFHSIPLASSTTSQFILLQMRSDRSLFIFPKRTFLRHRAHAIMHYRWTENFMLLLIFVSSIQLAIDDPLSDPSAPLSRILSRCDNIFTCIFAVEMVLKVIDQGLVLNGPSSYLRDPWNILDGAILANSFVTLSSGQKELRSLRSLRTLRALRPLRVIGRIPGMKRVVNALLSSIPYIFNVSLVCILIFLSFGIIATNLLKGKLYACDFSIFPSEKVLRLEHTYGFTKLSFKKLFSEQNCIEEGGTWILQRRNYNNVLKSAMTLFEVATTEGWVDIMYQSVDATKIGYHPVQNWNRAYIAFFIVFIIIGCFFTLNLFVGAVIDNFNRMRDTLSLGVDCSETQREWLQIQENIRTLRVTFDVIAPTQPLRGICFNIVQHQRFKTFVGICILLNSMMLAVTHFNEPPFVATFMHYGNTCFWVLFFIEAILKLVAFGRQYFRDAWNWFDFLILSGSVVSMVLTQLTYAGASPSFTNALRAFRMGLAIRLMKRAKSMQSIVSTILDNMPALINVSTLMFLIMFVYAVIGVQLYAGVMMGKSLNEHDNFEDVGKAIVTLFRFTTGEAWNDVMYDLMIVPKDGEAPSPLGKSCVEDYTYEILAAARVQTGNPKLTIGCSPGIVITYAYFLSYMLITTYVLLNLFVAVILEGFEVTTEKNAVSITMDDLQHAVALWKRYDKKGTGKLDDHTLLKMMWKLPPPLGLPKSATRHDIYNWALQLPLQLDSRGRISINAFLVAAAQCTMIAIASDRGDAIELAQQLSQHTQQSGKIQNQALLMEEANLSMLLSSKRIQSAVRKLIARNRLMMLKSQPASALINSARELQNAQSDRREIL